MVKYPKAMYRVDPDGEYSILMDGVRFSYDKQNAVDSKDEAAAKKAGYTAKLAPPKGEGA